VREEERMEGKILDRSGMKRMREKGEFNFKKKSQVPNDQNALQGKRRDCPPLIRNLLIPQVRTINMQDIYRISLIFSINN
jgi:hypothetical protein